MIPKITLFSLLIACASCSKSTKSDNELIRSSEWILGKWEQQSSEGKLTENWVKTNDSTLTATSFFIREKDTIHKEYVSLQQVGDSLIFKTKIIGQNNNQPLVFSSKEEIENQLQFENPNQDYPQKISYSTPKANQLVVQISGKQLGKPSTEKYTLSKK
ncbi:DUF6265 family protein [Flavobacterium sp. UMI-01]|uniref:DUF6265 family protein n=1 Tax=Flavobacterium sp. UMI-01 TaxID=1441053 RepID=UPI00207EA0BD|nr:DUF6265 family protein [Flavobacterium sp. UMI-01]GIZ10565.1 hypothetical protein FUMI01_32890 [Flavobacterium sp. UMI-01]